MKKIKLDLFAKTILQKIADGEVIAPQLLLDPDAQVQAAGTALDTATKDLNKRDTERTQKEDDSKAATVALHTQEIQLP